MTKKRIPPPPVVRTTLRIKKNSFINEIDSFIKRFKDVKARTINTKEELDAAEHEYYHIVEVGDEFLKSAFNKDDNEHRTDFYQAGSMTGVLDAFARNTQGRDLQYHLERVDSKIRNLEVLKEKTNYILHDGDLISEEDEEEYFTPNQKLLLNQRLDQILAKFADTKNELQTGQEVIFDEIESLRPLLNEKKKTFVSKLKDILIGLGVKKLFDKDVLKWIWDTISGDFLRLDQ